MHDASRPNRREEECASSSAALNSVFEFHDEILRSRAAGSAESFLSDLAAALDAREIAEAEGDARRTELAVKEVERRIPAFEALLSALREIEKLSGR